MPMCNLSFDSYSWLRIVVVVVGGCCRVEEFSWYIGRGRGGGGDEEVVNSYLRNEM